MPQKFVGKWKGGRVKLVDGRKVWLLEKMVSGARFSVSLAVSNEEDALAELALFRRDRDAYLARVKADRTEVTSAFAEAGAAPLLEDTGPRLDADSVREFLRHLTQQGRTEGYRRDARTYLSQWAEVLAGRDLRSVSLLELRRALSQWSTARKMRIITLKSFFSWLREEDRLKAAEDPTLSLKVPPAVAAQPIFIGDALGAMIPDDWGGHACIHDPPPLHLPMHGCFHGCFHIRFRRHHPARENRQAGA